MIFEAQPGKQSDFLACQADICFYGGAAGGGKSFGLLLDALRCALKYPHFSGGIFRRKTKDIRVSGGLWDESMTIFPYFNARPRQNTLDWTFPNGSNISFYGIKEEDAKYTYLGSQFDFLGFDELTAFTAAQFWFLLGRLRSRTGHLKPYCRATCNPEPDHWIGELLDWWIDDDGYPIAEHSNIIRWMVNVEDTRHFFDSKNEAVNYIHNNDRENKERLHPQSFTFIPAKIDDNPALLKNNPNYLATLTQMDVYERMKYLYGNWKFKPKGSIFNVSDFKNFAINPANPDLKTIIVDSAMEIKTHNDFTVAEAWSRQDFKIYLEEAVRAKLDFGMQLQMIVSMVLTFKPHFLLIEKAANGTALAQEIRKQVAVPIIEITRKKDKYTRGWEAANYVQSGYVYLNPQADYYAPLIGECSNFSPENENNAKMHDDMVDPLMDAVDYMLIKDIKAPDQRQNKIARPKNHAVPIFKS